MSFVQSSSITPFVAFVAKAENVKQLTAKKPFPPFIGQ